MKLKTKDVLQSLGLKDKELFTIDSPGWRSSIFRFLMEREFIQKWCPFKQKWLFTGVTINTLFHSEIERYGGDLPIRESNATKR